MLDNNLIIGETALGLVQIENQPVTNDIVSAPDVPRYFHSTSVSEYTVSEGYLFLISMLLLLGVVIKIFNR